MVRANAAVFYTTSGTPLGVHPALVVRINVDGTVDLDVFYPEGNNVPVRVRNVPEGLGPHTWFDPFRARPTKHFP
jgi:hypothetical protein